MKRGGRLDMRLCAQLSRIADGFAVCESGQYKISKIKLSISMIAVTPAMESAKASLASW
jgi:hypothetical protein